jgi:tripartite ATP-independent transporter DctM subunit
MSGIEIGAALFCSMLALMALRVPIAVAMFIPGAIGYLLLASPAALFSQLKGIAFARYSNYDLSVIPMFLLMGEFATHGGLSRALFRFGNTLLGHWRGGMAMASMIASAIFGGPCGSSVATTATVAQVALPELRRHHYSGRFATGTVAAGGVLGILIPPSVVLVVFAILAEQNIAKLFAASLIPSLIATVGYLVVIAVYARLHPEEAPLQTRQSRRAFFAALLDVSPMLAIFAVMLGGIYLGVFTPTEGGAVGAAGAVAAAALGGAQLAPHLLARDLLHHVVGLEPHVGARRVGRLAPLPVAVGLAVVEDGGDDHGAAGHDLGYIAGRRFGAGCEAVLK